jgi:MFS family permease
MQRQAPLAATQRAPTIAPLLAVLIATGSLSQFYRSSNAVLAPELIRDLGLSAQMLGAANSAFFVALLLIQIPVGVLFDRIGVRWTLAVLSLPMTLGAALHTFADTGPMLWAARFLVGLGCAGSFMASVVLIPRWVARDRWSTVLGWVFAISQIGYFLAGAPLAYAAETIGWRQAFLWTAGLSALVGVGVVWIVRDQPAGAPLPAASARDPIGLFEGLRRIVTIPGMIKLYALFGVAYATMFAIAGLWVGPYLRDVHGLDAIARGQVLTAVAAALVLGNFIIGPLDRLMRSSKRLVLSSAGVAMLTLLIWAVLPAPPLWLAIGLLLLLCASSSYGPILLAQIRARVPDHLAGRGATTANMAQLSGTALMPLLTGLLPPLFATPAAGGYAPDAYRAMFLLLALVLALGVAVYATLDETTR